MHDGALNIPNADLYLLVGDERQGPFTIEDLQRKFAAQEISRATFLWYPGLLNWVTVGDIPQFNQRAVVAMPEATHPAPGPKEEVWTYENLKVVGLTVEALRLKIKENAYRRGDLIFFEAESKWVRADQHPLFTEMFAAPVAPPSPTAPADAGSSSAGIRADEPLLPVASPRKPNTWIYQGVGFACFLLVVFAWFAWTPHPAERAPASAERVESPPSIQVGMREEAFYAHPGFAMCAAVSPSGAYRCAEIEPGFASLWLTFKQGILFQIEGRFAQAEQGKVALRKWASFWGSAETRAVNCATLSGQQEAQYGALCKSGALRVHEWKTNEVWARCLSTGSTPLEIKVVQTHR
jgi:hypothetical protein